MAIPMIMRILIVAVSILLLVLAFVLIMAFQVIVTMIAFVIAWATLGIGALVNACSRPRPR